MKHLLLSILVFLLAGATHAQDSITGHWHIDTGKTIAAIPSQLKADFDSLTQEVKDQIINEMVGQEFVFESNGVYQTNTGSESYSGSWELQGGAVQITFDQGGVFTQSIISSDETTLVLGIVTDPNSQAFFHELHLQLADQ